MKKVGFWVVLFFCFMTTVVFATDLDSDGDTDCDDLAIAAAHRGDDVAQCLDCDVNEDGTLTIQDEVAIYDEISNPICAEPGDLDEDGDIDKDDVNIIKAYVNQPASVYPECDIDGDGNITVLDARKLMLMCTCSRCLCP